MNGGYVGFVASSPVFVKQNEEGLAIFSGEGRTVPGIREFFRLDDPLEDIIGSWKHDPHLSAAARIFRGLRLTRQEPWDCLLSFVLSMVSNIPKIETGLEKLAHHCGEQVMFLGIPLYTLPSPEKVASLRESTLRRFGIGFRARYLRGCARGLARGFLLDPLRKLPYLDARKALMALPGIGEKVADCILLYSLGHLEAFPVDVWMKRILEHCYFKKKRKTERYLSDWGRDRFGPWAGYAQQYLYAFGRYELDRRSPFREQATPRRLR